MREMQKFIVWTSSRRKPDLLGSAAGRNTCSNLLVAAMQGQLLISEIMLAGWTLGRGRQQPFGKGRG